MFHNYKSFHISPPPPPPPPPTVHFFLGISLPNIHTLGYYLNTYIGTHTGYILSNFAYNCVGIESRLYDCNRATHSTCVRQHSVGELRSVILTCMGQTPGIMYILFLFKWYNVETGVYSTLIHNNICHKLQSILNIPDMKLGSL